MATESKPLSTTPSVLYDVTVRTPIAPLHGEPRIASQMISQQLAGHRLSVFDEEGDWICVRGADEYEGWMHTGFVARTPATGARQSRTTPRISLGCTTRASSGRDAGRALPLRAILAPDETLATGEAIDGDDRARRFPLDPVGIVDSAKRFFAGTSYLWGGVTPWGADCSGLVQSVFALHGLQLPRDAWRQAERGADAGRDIGELRAADLLFFTDREDGRVTHVGIAAGGARMVHLALGRGGYAVERLGDRNDPYVEKLRQRFLFARRLI
jgi:cell wall-associated NlpC family hydrolase